MKPSSSTSETSSATGLFDGVLARGDAARAVGDDAWVRAMLDVEAALAHAQARAGLIGAESAQAISRACTNATLDIAELGRDAADAGNPVVPLVRALRALTEGAAADDVHRGATSQDVLDTAAALVARRALAPLLEDLSGAADAAAALARSHRSTLMIGRTLLQAALPTTFGCKAAVWLVGLDEARSRLGDVDRLRLAVQLGGAAGTLAAMGDAGPAVVRELAEELHLSEPPVPWHTNRTRVAELAGALGEAAGACGKPALDVILLAQTEVGEAGEGGPDRGRSSTLPHKKNPIAAVSAVASAKQTPGLVATLLASMTQEHERAAGSWHAEWRPMAELFRATGSAAAWLRDCLERLEVDPATMRANLERTGGQLLAERVATALAPSLGHSAANDLVREVSLGAAEDARSFAELLVERPDVRSHLDRERIDELLDPATYLGSAKIFVDRALDAHEGAPAAPDEQ